MDEMPNLDADQSAAEEIKADPGFTDKPKRRQRGKTEAQEDKELTRALTDMLSMPCVPYAMGGHVWLAERTAESSEKCAQQLVDIGKRHPPFRETLERLTAGSSIMSGATAVAMWGLPQVLYFTKDSQQTLAMKRAFGVPPQTWIREQLGQDPYPDEHGNPEESGAGPGGDEDTEGAAFPEAA